MLHTRQQLINWLVKNVHDPVIQQCLEWGQTINLGGFAPLPTSQNPGWVVKLISRFGREYYIAVGVKDFEIYWFRLKKESIDWDNWVGEESENELFRGDGK